MILATDQELKILLNRIKFLEEELDKDYFEAQEKRFKLETLQQTLF